MLYFWHWNSYLLSKICQHYGHWGYGSDSAPAPFAWCRHCLLLRPLRWPSI